MHADYGQPRESPRRYRHRERGRLAPRPARSAPAEVPVAARIGLIVVAALLVGVALRMITADGAAERGAALRATVERTRAATVTTRELSSYEQFLDRVGARRRAVAELARRRTGAGGVLAGVVAALPPGVVLKRVCDGAANGCGVDPGAVALAGCARSGADVARLLEKLRKVPALTRVDQNFGVGEVPCRRGTAFALSARRAGAGGPVRPSKGGGTERPAPALSPSPGGAPARPDSAAGERDES